MNVTFSSATLATLCNSERHLAGRWGADMGRTVGRRLLELAASDLSAIERLPQSEVNADGAGVMIINFGDEVTVQGVVSNNDGTECIRITAVDVQGSVTTDE